MKLLGWLVARLDCWMHGHAPHLLASGKNHWELRCRVCGAKTPAISARAGWKP